MITNYSEEIPDIMIREGAKRKLNYNVMELSLEEIKELWKQEHPDEATEPDEWYIKSHRYSYNMVILGGGKWNYSGIVEAIIRDKYTADEMEAISNNMNIIVSGFFETLVTSGIIAATKYLVESIKSDESARFKEMQSWRAFAKTTARQILKIT